MAGTKEGGRKAAEKNKQLYGDDFYAKIGAKGGKNGRTGGFASLKLGSGDLTGPERARIYGAIGGKNSKRGPAKRREDEEDMSVYVKLKTQAKRIQIPVQVVESD